jgi:ArsR family transcriptional regulator
MHVCIYDLRGENLVNTIPKNEGPPLIPGPALTQEVTALHAEMCSALADTNRILMLYALSESPLNVTDLANQVGISQPAASRHLKVLRERGIVRAQRQGANVSYTLEDERLIQALDLLRQVMRDRISYHASLIENTNEIPSSIEKEQ